MLLHTNSHRFLIRFMTVGSIAAALLSGCAGMSGKQTGQSSSPAAVQQETPTQESARYADQRLPGIGVIHQAGAASIEAAPEQTATQGTESWLIHRRTRTAPQGYASAVSVLPRQQLTFFINSTFPYHVSFYRMGYYGGLGARLYGQTREKLPDIQHAPVNAQTMDAGWKASFAYTIPRNWPTGFYLAKITDLRQQSGYVPFVVRQANPSATFAVLIATSTYQAYNNWGGKSLYSYNSTAHQQAYTVSFNRPFSEEYGAGQFFMYEYNLVRWLEKNRYSLTYLTDTDIDRGALSKAHVRALLIAGHDEYWSMNERNAMESATARQMNLGDFGSDTGDWQVRYASDAQGNVDRLMICYRSATKDPLSKTHPSFTTVKWSRPPVNRPQEQVLGSQYTGVIASQQDILLDHPPAWMLRGTGLQPGDHLKKAVWGEADAYRGKLPGVTLVAHTPVLLGHLPNDTYKGYSDVVWYQKPTGGKVFATGTFAWSWLLDGFQQFRSHYGVVPSSAVQEMTRNVLQALGTMTSH
ncbi:MAG: hypothetical protein IMW91_11015 [Firmicutes bacterium]|nr:hypothetical protein [Bacillota bacterium]